MKYVVKILRRAEADVRAITTYIRDRSPQGAANWLDAFNKTLRRLEDHADACGACPENDRFKIEVKQALFRTTHGKPYRLLFAISQNEVIVLRLRGPGQAPVDPQDI